MPTTDAAPEPEYDDQGRLLLPPIVYDPVLDDKGRRIGWKVPEQERETWDALDEQRRERRGVYAQTKTRRVEAEPKPIQQLVIEIESWVDMDIALETFLRSTYELNPGKVTRVCGTVIQGCQAGTLRSPGGLLYARLKEVSQAAD